MAQGSGTQRGGTERRATGRNAASVKYDLLSALGAHACAGDKHLQRLVLRLMTLIVARYNWIGDELAVGQREMAELWSIDERSVKRDLARLRDMGWLVVKRPAARGRVAVHGLDLARILTATQPAWPRVGPDFVARMAAPASETAAGTPAGTAAAPSNVISFPAPRGGEGVWPRLQTQLHREDPGLYGAWFAALRGDEGEPGLLRLVAPTRFHATYLRTNLLQRLERMAAALAGMPLRVEIDGPA